MVKNECFFKCIKVVEFLVELLDSSKGRTTDGLMLTKLSLC